MTRRGRLASVALGCLFFLASCCSRGADGKVEVSTTSVVEAEVGGKAVIACNFSIAEDVAYAYVNWFYMDKNDRKKIISMIRGKEHLAESEFKGRVSLTDELSLAIENVGLQDAKTYVCQVGAGSAGVGENRSELHVFKAPEAPELEATPHLTASPTDSQKIAACTSRNGYPEPTIEWYKDGGLLEHNEEHGISIHSIITKESSGLVTMHSILMAQVTKEDRKALYHCRVNYNLMGINKTMESESFRINVYYPSENITLEIRAPNKEVKEGDNVTLFCEADGNPPPLYTFYRTLLVFQDRLPLIIVEPNPRHIYLEVSSIIANGAYSQGGEEVDSPGALNGELFLQGIRKEDSDVYQCQAFDSQSEFLKAEVNLYVNYIDAPNITREPPRHSLRRGDNLTLTCEAEGSKHLEFQWQKKGKVVMEGRRLTFTNMAPRDSSDYSCIVTMPGVPGLSRSRSVSVAVHSEPEMVGLKDVVYVKGGERLNLTCSAVSVPVSNFRWSVSEKPRTATPSHYQINSTVSILVTEELLETGVNCTAHNRFGIAVHHFRLETRSEEPVTTGLPAGTDVSPSPSPSLPGNETSGFGYSQTAAPQTPGGAQNGTAGSSPEKGNETSGFRYNQTAAPQAPGGPQNGTAGSSPETEKQKLESKGVIIVAVVVCVLLIAVLGSVLYFLHKKGKLPCGRSGKQEITKPEAPKDKIVVEVKSDKLPEEAELLQDANGEKRSAGDQGERYIDLRN